MKRFLLIVVLISQFKSFYAQDTLAVKHKKMHRHHTEIDTTEEKVNRLLYNYTSETINNVFNEDLRKGATNRLTVNFDYAANSNSVSASFLYGLLFNNGISDKTKDRVDKRIKDRLKFSDDLKTGFTYEHYLPKWGGSFYLSYNQRQMRVVNGGKQAYETLFYGNSRFEGDSADFSNILVQNFIYNQYTGGVRKKIDYGTYQMEVGAGLSFLQVINNQDIRTNNASLYTAPDGEYIDLHYDLSLNTALEGAPKFFALNGIGASGDFHLGFMNKDKWKITADLSDVGVMTFRKQPVNYVGANAVHFTGIIINDLLSLGSQTFDTLKLDSAFKSYLPARTNNKYQLFVPFTFNLAFSKPLMHDKLVLTLGFQYKNLPKYYGYGYAKINYFIKKDMVFSASLGGGGYSWGNVGVEFSKHWKYFDFALGSANLLGLVLPANYTGTGVYLRLGTSF